MRWRRVTFWGVFGTLALVVLLLSWLWIADLGVFRPQLERLVAEKTGREFAIDGAFHVDLARHASVIAEDIRFGNADWAKPDDMVTVGRLELRVDLWSLLGGPLVIELVDIDNARIYLTNPADGDPNWVLPIATGEQSSEHDRARGPAALLGQLDVDDVKIVIDSAERDRPLDLDIRRLQQTQRDDGYLDLRLRATLNGRSVSIDGEAGTWDALLAGRDFGFDVDAVLDTFELSAKGRVDDLANLRRPEIEFTASGPDIDDLTRLLGLGEEGEGDIRISGSLARRNDDHMMLNVKGNIGMTQIDASGTVADLKSFDNIGLKAVASGPDLGRILRLVGIHQVRQAPFMLRLDAETRGEAFVVNEAQMVFADAHLDGSATFPHFPSVDDAIVSLQIEGPDIERFRYVTGIPGAATGPFSLGFTIDVGEDGVEVLELNASTALGKAHAGGRIGDPNTFAGSRFNFSVETDSLARIAGAYGLADMPDVAIEVAGAAEYTDEAIVTHGPVKVTMDGIAAAVEGRVPLTPGIQGADVTFDAKGPDLAALAGMFATVTGIPALPFEAKGRIQAQKDGYHLRNVTGSLGSSALRVDGLLAAAPGMAGTHAEFTAGGAAFEELLGALGDIDVRPGPYELAGRISLTGDALKLQKIALDRAQGSLRAELALGMPVSKRALDFDLRADGRDVRIALRGVKRFEAFEQPFTVRALGRLRGPHWTFDEMDVSVGDARIDARGDLEFADARAETEFRFDLNVPNLARLGTLDGRKFRDQALAITAHVAGGQGELRADQMDVRIGDSDIKGAAKLILGDVPEIAIDVRSERLVYLPFLEEKEFEYDPEPEFQDGRLIPNVQLPFDALQQINAVVDVDIRELQRGALFLGDIALNMTLRDGLLEISNIHFRARSGELLAKARLDPADGTGAASLQLVARDLAFGLSETNRDLDLTGDADVVLRSTGADLRTLAGNASGVVFVNTRGGRLTNNEFVQAIYGNMLEEILNTINPFRKSDPYTDLECVVVPLTIDDGQVAAAPSIFAGTAKMRLASQPSLNLKTEEIRIGVRTTPKRTISISAAELFNPYVQIVGTLAAPRLAVDETGVLITGGAAVATGGLSLLARGLWDRMSRSGDACKQATQQAVEALAGRMPDLQIEGTTRLE